MLHLRHLWKSARVLQRLKKSCARQPRNFFAMTSTMQQASQILENEQWFADNLLVSCVHIWTPKIFSLCLVLFEKSALLIIMGGRL